MRAKKQTVARIVVMMTIVVAGVASFVLQPQSSYADITPTELVARWTFDGLTSGDNAPDSIGTNTAIPGGGTPPQASSDVPSVSYTNTTSMEFDGSNYFTINNPVAKNFTICAWIKTTSSGGGSAHWTSAPIMDSEVGGVAYDFGFGVGNGGKLMFGNGGVYPGDDPDMTGAYWDQQVNGATTINDDMWHNVCVTRDGSTGENILYVDAQVDGSGYSGIGTQRQNLHARIGWGYDGAALYQGLIDDVRVYDGVLSQAQLANLTAGSDNPDYAPGDDGDGVDGTVEDGAPNSGDANNDGTADSSQANVASFVSSTSSHYISVAADGACSLSATQTQAASELASDGNYTYPVGLVNFTAHCASTQVKVYFYNPPAGDVVLRKYINGQYQTVAGATLERVTIGGQAVVVATYTVVDGGSLDADGIVNGEIVDPVGLALPGGAALAATGENTILFGTIAASLMVAALGILVAYRRFNL